MQIIFHKYQGTGNDFVIIDNRSGAYNGLTKAQIKHICDRRFGIGADGLMLFNLAEGYDFEMKYYNADGGESSMCGNGGRCLVQFAWHQGLKKENYHFLAVDGPHEAERDEHTWISLKMKDVNAVRYDRNHFILDTGSPHYVAFVSDVMAMNVQEKGHAIRYSKEFAAEGINVNFVENLGKRIIVRTYERGVEAETLSCGTGVTAAALMAAHNDRGFNEVNIQTPGGHLIVEFDRTNDAHFTNIWLCGPAVKVYEGMIEIVE
jgi:diaminopimelate epimerase